MPELPPERADAPDSGSSVQQVLKLARYMLRDYLRSRRFVLMMAIVAILGTILTAVVAYYRPEGLSTNPLDFYANFWGMGATIVIVFAGVIFGGDAIAGEFQNKTGYFLMGLPIRRAAIYAGKFLAALAASITAMVAYLVILLANGAYYFGGDALPWQLGASFLLALVYLLALMGSVFLFSSLFKTSTYATLVVAVLFLFGFSIIQVLITDLVKVEPWFVITYASSVLENIFVSPFPPHVASVVTGIRNGTPLTVTVYTATVPESVGIMLAYFLLTSLLGLLLFEREEFT